MGQGSLFGGWEATNLEVQLGFVPNSGSGYIHVGTLDEAKRALTHNSVTWRKERDLAGAPDLLRDLGQRWLYGTPEDVTVQLDALVRKYLPQLSAVQRRS